MSTALFRSAPALRAGLRARSIAPAASFASTSFVRTKATLPDLPCTLPTYSLYVHSPSKRCFMLTLAVFPP